MTKTGLTWYEGYNHRLNFHVLTSSVLIELILVIWLRAEYILELTSCQLSVLPSVNVVLKDNFCAKILFLSKLYFTLYSEWEIVVMCFSLGGF